MKQIIIILVFMTGILKAQVKDWYGCDLSRLGYKNSTIIFENAANGYASQHSSKPFRMAKAHSFDLSVDIYTKHVFFSFDGSLILDFSYYLIAKYSAKSSWWNNAEYKMDKNEFIPARLGFGLPITKYASLYAGGQYQYVAYGLKPKANDPSLRFVELIGSQYGLGIHFAAAYKMFHFRYSYMYDWISQKKTGMKGSAITNEMALHFGPKKYGAFIKINNSYRNSREYVLVTESSKTNGTYKPSEYINQYTISVGIFAAGLFSGVAHGASKAAGNTEINNANERNKEKKRKIEWKE